ncbi:hypothetical protein GCM10023185_25810 [Hymenobacter saemangeumensis]|uniref:Uncharacterized protein n=1 Tax=Hymenobacter saemangeumensis TaxID=1084522 RepID=A0ABP8IHZ8_9BACT
MEFHVTAPVPYNLSGTGAVENQPTAGSGVLYSGWRSFMRLIAFRPEYQLTVDPARNRIFYKHYQELGDAVDLPDYLTDWQQALDAVQTGFTILTDVTNLPSTSEQLMQLFVQAQQLCVSRGVRQVAEVHSPEADTYKNSRLAREQSAMPVRTFSDLWEADKYLDDLAAPEARVLDSWPPPNDSLRFSVEE